MYDTHAHLISDDMDRYPPSPLSGELREGALDDPMTAERLLREMDAHGVERAVVVQRAHVYGYDNRYVVDSANRYRDRLSAVCVIDAQAPDAVSSVRRWIGDAGAAGIRLTESHKGADPGWFASEQAQECWRETTALGGSVCLQFYRWNRDACLAALPEVLSRFPATPVVIDHVTSLVEDGPDLGLDAGLTTLAAHPQVTFKFTTINLARMQKAGFPAGPLLTRLVDLFGARRLMWGSDVAQSPQTYAEMVELARTATEGLTAVDARMLLSGAAATFYPGGGVTGSAKP